MVRALAVAVLTVASMWSPASAAVVGKPSPEFAIRFNNGSQKLLSSYRGKVVLLEFLHTTCPHCQHASQVFSQLYTEYGDKGFQPLGVAWNDMASLLVPDFIKDFKVSYPVGYAPREEVLTYLGFSEADRTVVPQLVWIDRKGVVRSQTPAIGDETMLKEPYWRQMIETLIKEPGPAASHGTAPHHTHSSTTRPSTQG
jgi:peroxiredoxin